MKPSGELLVRRLQSWPSSCSVLGEITLAPGFWPPGGDSLLPMLASSIRRRPSPRSQVPPPPALRAWVSGRQAAVLLNARAKSVTPKLRRAFADLLPERDIYYSESMDDARQMTRDILARRYKTLLVGGGDGTQTVTMNLLLEAARDLAEPGGPCPLPDIGVLRFGTGNALACHAGSGRPLIDAKRALGLNRPIAKPLRLLEDKATGLVFPFGSVGYDARLINDYRDLNGDGQAPSWLTGLPGYFYAAGTRTIPYEIRQTMPKVQIRAVGAASMIDPKTEESVELELNAPLYSGPMGTVVFGSTPFYGYGIRALPAALRQNDRFQLRVATASALKLLPRLPRLWRGTLKDRSMLDFLVEAVEIHCETPLPMQLAGDAHGMVSHLRLSLSDRVFRLIPGERTGA